MEIVQIRDIMIWKKKGSVVGSSLSRENGAIIVTYKLILLY